MNTPFAIQDGTARGGSWPTGPLYATVRYRGTGGPWSRDENLGFRLLRRVP